MRIPRIFVAAALPLALCLGTIPANAQRGRAQGQPARLPESMPSQTAPGKPAEPQKAGKPAGTAQKPADTHMANKPMVSEQLTQKPQLSSKLQGMLPANTNLTEAANGFKDLGQFVAAVHASHNLNIPFDQLKSKMVGGKSLGDAIHELKPDVNAKAEAKKANREAKEDIKTPGS